VFQNKRIIIVSSQHSQELQCLRHFMTDAASTYGSSRKHQSLVSTVRL